MVRRPLVLVIDDNDDLRENVQEILVECGLEAAGAARADDAVRLLESGARGPEAILLDVIMPGMSARRFVSIVRDCAAWRSARIIAFSAALDAEVPPGVDGFLPKPFRIEQLLGALRAVGVDAPASGVGA